MLMTSRNGVAPGFHIPPPMQLPPSCDANPAPSEKRITLWNKVQRRKISGNAAPMERNLQNYLKKHPECEVYDGQDKGVTKDASLTSNPLLAANDSFSTSASGAPTLSFSDTRGPFQPNPLHHVNNSFPHDHFMSSLGTSMAWNVEVEVEKNQERRITIWHKTQQRKISGNAAPMEKNLTSYLSTHHDCEIYVNQDKEGSQSETHNNNNPSSSSAADSTATDDTQQTEGGLGLGGVDGTPEFDSPFCGGIGNPALDIETELHQHFSNINFTPPPPRSSHLHHVSHQSDSIVPMFSSHPQSNPHTQQNHMASSNSPFLSPRVSRIALLAGTPSNLTAQMSPMSTVESFDSSFSGMDFSFTPGQQPESEQQIMDPDFNSRVFANSSQPFQPGTFLQGF